MHMRGSVRLFRGRFLQALLDLAAWAVGLSFAFLTRYGIAGEGGRPSALLAVIAFAAVLHLGIGLSLRLYQGRYRVGSFDEAYGVARAVGLTTLVLCVLNLVSGPVRLVPVTVPLAGG